MQHDYKDLPVTPEEEAFWRETQARIDLERARREQEERDRARQPEVND